MIVAFVAAAGNSGAIFGLAAIGCWMLLLFALFSAVLGIVRKDRKRALISTSFLLGAVGAGIFIGQLVRPESMSVGATLEAGLTHEGLYKYGHPVEHRSEVAIILTTYASVIGGGVCAGVAATALRIAARKRTVDGPAL